MTAVSSISMVLFLTLSVGLCQLGETEANALMRLFSAEGFLIAMPKVQRAVGAAGHRSLIYKVVKPKRGHDDDDYATNEFVRFG